MAEPHPFHPVKLICGIISANESYFRMAEEHLISLYGTIDRKSPFFPFGLTDYYEKQMGKSLSRVFVSFEKLIQPVSISDIKLRTNRLEEEIKKELSLENRAVNLDPGFMTASALFMATAKDFAHRVPLRDGIYGHLELLFGKKDVKTLDWTYPDFKTKRYQDFFLDVRMIYLGQMRRYKP